MMVAKPYLDQVQKKVEAANQSGNSQQLQNATKELWAVYRQHKANPFSMLGLAFVQIPIFVSCLTAFRELHMYFPGVTSGGALWFTDLAASDPTYMLPLLTSATMMLSAEFGPDGSAHINPQTQQMKVFFRAGSVIMLPFIVDLPQSVLLYWVISNTFTVTQGALLRNDSIRRALGLRSIEELKRINARAAQTPNPVVEYFTKMKSDLQEGLGLKKEVPMDQQLKSLGIDSSAATSPAPVSEGGVLEEAGVAKSTSEANQMGKKIVESGAAILKDGSVVKTFSRKDFRGASSGNNTGATRRKAKKQQKKKHRK
uniref:Membrane insertase YidC/Oxa/ALB C-terminal domain-containing protein n=1 Tax=Fibrocapsa japonica TaxID=94617 RepID=A0A7S2V1K0_9STRA|mmetsp:Transcript_2871/g.4230  ORF Transcript_2871/g.4230 Transcript_2871/m.4230 type:complete len:313 (+) Transcript_2871:3-941(+)